MPKPLTLILCAIGTVSLVHRFYGTIEDQNQQYKVEKCVTKQLADPTWVDASETYKQSMALSGCKCGYSLIQHGGFTDLDNVAEACTKLSNLEYRNQHETSTF